MGVFGTSISSSDTFKDVYADFIHRYNQEVPVSKIVLDLKDAYRMSLSDPDESNDVILAIVKAEWDCGFQDRDFINSFKNFKINDIERWQNLGAKEKDLKKRAEALDQFFEKISFPNPKPRKLKKIILKEPLLKIGDCLAYKLDDGRYGGSIVIFSSGLDEYPRCIIAITDIHKETLPTIQDFKKSNLIFKEKIYYLKSLKPIGRYFFFINKFSKNIDFGEFIVGNLSVAYPFNTTSTLTAADFKKDIIDFTANILEGLRLNPDKFNLINTPKAIKRPGFLNSWTKRLKR